MRGKSLSVLLASMLLFALVPAGHALYGVVEGGAWPETWPEELEALRPQARSLYETWGCLHEITFTNREDFESAWPHILSLLDKNGTLTLIHTYGDWFGMTGKAGVRVHAPLTGTWVDMTGAVYSGAKEKPDVPSREFLQIGPPWPDSVRTESGELPQWVIIKDGVWVPHQPESRRDGSSGKRTLEEMREESRNRLLTKRAGIDIELIVDAKIVDMNRIPLPGNVRIVDNRFSGGRNSGNTQKEVEDGEQD